MICIEIIETGERRRLEHPVYLTVNRNGPVATPHRERALGIGDGEHIWSLGGLTGCPEAKIITLAQLLEGQGEEISDPELSAEEALNIILGGSYESK